MKKIKLEASDRVLIKTFLKDPFSLTKSEIALVSNLIDQIIVEKLFESQSESEEKKGDAKWYEELDLRKC